MKKIFLLKYGEIGLKGKNRIFFEKKLINNIKAALKDYKVWIEKPFGRLILTADLETEKEQKEILSILTTSIFGLYSVAICYEIARDFDSLIAYTLQKLGELNLENKSFKVQTKRAVKDFPYDSMTINRELGAKILEKFPTLKVKMDNPDLVVIPELLEDKFLLYFEKHRALGGLPVGISGNTLLFLSGGIDSPVAGYLAQKRGCKLDCIYFHAPPYTSEKAKEKVLKLATHLKKYQNQIRVFVVNFTNIQLTLKKHVKMEYFVILGRRMMVRIANKIIKENKIKAFITGENLGQVASQTLENLHCINSLSKLPILRPLITYDKTEIMDLARQIGTYDTSILPYDDCCSLFLPPNPNTKAKVKYLEIEEAKVKVDYLIEEALKNTTEVII